MVPKHRAVFCGIRHLSLQRCGALLGCQVLQCCLSFMLVLVCIVLKTKLLKDVSLVPGLFNASRCLQSLSTCCVNCLKRSQSMYIVIVNE